MEVPPGNRDTQVTRKRKKESETEPILEKLKGPRRLRNSQFADYALGLRPPPNTPSPIGSTNFRTFAFVKSSRRALPQHITLAAGQSAVLRGPIANIFAVYSFM